MKINKLFLNCLGIACIWILSTVVLTNCSSTNKTSSSGTLLNNKEKYYFNNVNDVKSYNFLSWNYPSQYANKTVDEIKTEFGYQEGSADKNFTNFDLFETWVATSELTNSDPNDTTVSVNLNSSDLNYDYLNTISSAKFVIDDRSVTILFTEKANGVIVYLYTFQWLLQKQN